MKYEHMTVDELLRYAWSDAETELEKALLYAAIALQRDIEDLKEELDDDYCRCCGC